MTDRELLELAATAAGIDPDMAGPNTPREWNPLADDGDAFRLAVKLNLTVQFPWDDNQVFIKETHCWNAGDHPVEEEHGRGDAYDPYAATRRAIVRAAAEIGRAA